ncbi:MAG: hypothetical protein AAF493_10585 [Pseudomonadota bacterium]
MAKSEITIVDEGIEHRATYYRTASLLHLESPWGRAGALLREGVSPDCLAKEVLGELVRARKANRRPKVND